MKILSIETSCDETAVSVVDGVGGANSPTFKVLGDALFSQIDAHREFGGVYPMLAKREHAKNLPHILKQALVKSSLFNESSENIYPENIWKEVETILVREVGLYDGFKKMFENVQRPDVDFISVTSGPGLAPALWVGISFAVALGKLWKLPVVPTNHMEGHIASVLVGDINKDEIKFPALALLISGGHTELVEINSWGNYKVIGETLDDAVGEAFDKVARMLGLPYPGGPEISKLALFAKDKNIPKVAKLPRPMIHSDNLNFSFSGLKTSVLYYIRDNFNKDLEGNKELSMSFKADLAREFEDAVIDVLIDKTKKALETRDTKTLIIAGGVIANKRIREAFMGFEKLFPPLKVKIPELRLATDNATMIACAAYINVSLNPRLISEENKIIAEGNLKLGIKV